METGPTASAPGMLRDIFEEGPLLGLDDAALLGRYRNVGDERAFEALVARHGPMVLGVCRRILRDPHAIDDAFQATFLVFVRKAATIGRPERLGPWLYGVASRVATRARRQAAIRRAKEGPVGAADPPDRPHAGPEEELREVFDEELCRLPEAHRAALVLCALEGLTHDEAAARLGWPVGTVRSRLSRGRERLRRRLSRRGFTPALLASEGLGALLTPASPAPPAVIEGAVRAARTALARPITAGAASGTAAALAEGVLNAMRLARFRTLLASLLAAAVVGTGSALLATQPGGPDASPADAGPVPKPAPRAVTKIERPVTSGESPVTKPVSVAPTDPFGGPVSPATELRTTSPRELRARLAQAKERVRLRSNLFQRGMLSQGSLAEARGEVELVEALIADEVDRLQDELELLRAQRKVQAAVVEAAAARFRWKIDEFALIERLQTKGTFPISKEELRKSETDKAVERAHLSEEDARLALIDLQINQVQRRLQRLRPPGDENGPTSPPREQGEGKAAPPALPPGG